MIFYTVKRGDTLYSISRNFSLSPERIAFDNGINPSLPLAVGQNLILLIPEQIHTVKSDETLESITKLYGTDIYTLLRLNPFLASQNVLRTGQQIIIKLRNSSPREIRINGYLYPFINETLLARWLPFLSTVTVFGYGFTDDGELIAPDDIRIIQKAKDFSVAPIILLTSILENGNFSSERSSLLFNNIDLQNKVLANLIEVMREKGYKGLDIDFEFINPADRDAFTAFVQNATAQMNDAGYFVNTDLAPKSSASQGGLLYEAHDYQALGNYSNTVFLMTYEWGYTYGPPLAIAPLESVRKVAEYGVSEIDKNKILLGVPNYAYDWQLPYIKGTTAAKTLGNNEAAELAGRYNAEILFDENSQSPYFYYTENNKSHVVWFEDPKSINAKLELAFELDLLGIGYWNMMRPFSSNLALLSYLTKPIRI